MAGFSQHQWQALQDVTESMQYTNYGQKWPKEYTRFFRLWGYFNRVYDVLYTDPCEWQRIARLALDSRVGTVWDVVKDMDAVRDLAQQPCVGNGRDDYEPSEWVRIASETLRREFQISAQEVCGSEKCQWRKAPGWHLCSERAWGEWPQKPSRTDDAKYTPLGATLTILYQIRNNLFHGSKLEIRGSQRKRNQLLVGLSAQITEGLLQQVVALVLGSPVEE